jgi:hypothetical protein
MITPCVGGAPIRQRNTPLSPVTQRRWHSPQSSAQRARLQRRPAPAAGASRRVVVAGTPPWLPPATPTRVLVGGAVHSFSGSQQPPWRTPARHTCHNMPKVPPPPAPPGQWTSAPRHAAWGVAPQQPQGTPGGAGHAPPSAARAPPTGPGWKPAHWQHSHPSLTGWPPAPSGPAPIDCPVTSTVTVTVAEGHSHSHSHSHCICHSNVHLSSCYPGGRRANAGIAQR